MNATVRLTRQELLGVRGTRFTYEVEIRTLPLLTLMIEVDPDRPSTYTVEFLPGDAWEPVDAADRHRMADEILIETLRRHAARIRAGLVH